jgi:septal ring factor EnvC (AmiA/AmiB activator)
MEELQDLMQNIDENRNQLEMLSRWPQTIKQIDKQLSQFARDLKRNKTTVDKLLKKGIDLASVYADFEAAVNKLKAVRDDAAAKMSSGDSEGAFDALENDFFGQMDEIGQYQQTIQMMANMGGFNSSFKKIITQAQNTINKLKKQKNDTAELANILEQAKSQGNEVLALMKAKPLDAEAIMAGMEELQNLNMEFSDKVAELTGEEQAMPWDTGQQQFQQLSMPSVVQKMMPQQTQPTQQCAPGTDCGPGTSGGGGNYVAP